MSRGRQRDGDLSRALNRELGMIGTQAVLLNQAIAERLHLHPTEVEVIDWLGRAGPLTAGQVAEVTGLTSGATTRLIDRLQRAGYVWRAPNPEDRRSVLVIPNDELIRRDLAPLFAPLEGALSALYAHYDPAQLALVVDFLSRVNAVIRAHIARLRADSETHRQPVADTEVGTEGER